MEATERGRKKLEELAGVQLKREGGPQEQTKSTLKGVFWVVKKQVRTDKLKDRKNKRKLFL